MKEHLTNEITTIAWCWKLKPRHGEPLGFTSTDKDIEIDGILFHADCGFTPSAICSSNKLNVDNLDVEGMLDSNTITEDDILSGKFDHAEIEIFMVDYTNISQGKLNLRTGWLGEVTLSKGQFVTEVRGLMQALTQNIGELYSPTCRARFADKRCNIDSAAYTYHGKVQKIYGANKFLDDSLKQKNGYFDYGVITFASGKNIGKTFEILSYFNHAIELFMKPYFEISEDDTFDITAGCDKHIDTCKQKFNNALNFRGEPHVPTLDKLSIT